MKINNPHGFVGWMFLGLGFLILILVVHISMIKDTTFIYDEELFRVAIIGIVICMSGFILVAIYNVSRALQNLSSVEVTK